MFWPIVLFIVGLVLLIKGGDWFVDGATGIAKRFKIPDILIGATVVSIGTTLPEVMVSATSAVQGHGEIAYGNAIGSIICNTALVAAVTIAIKPAKIERKTLVIPICFFFGAMAIYSAIAYITGYFSIYIGIALLVIFIVYMSILIVQALKKPAEVTVESVADAPVQDAFINSEAQLDTDPVIDTVEELKEVNVGEKPVPLWKEILLLVIGAAFIAVGARLLVDNGTIIATKLGVPESVIALTFVALGTSLPELVTAITSLIKGHGALSLGNIIGANLFNLVLVSGVSITLSPFAVPAGTMLFGHPMSLVLDIPIAFLVMGLMTLPALIRGKLSRWQGIVLIVVYAAFCAVQFIFS